MNKFLPYHIILLLIGFISVMNYIHNPIEMFIESVEEIRMVDSLVTQPMLYEMLYLPSPIESDTFIISSFPPPMMVERLDTVYVTVPKKEMIYVYREVERSFIGSIESIVVILGSMFNLVLGIFQFKEKRKKDLDN